MGGLFELDSATNPSTWTYHRPAIDTTYTSFSLDFDASGALINVVDFEANEVGTIDPITGEFVVNAALSGVPAGDTPTGLTTDPATGTVFFSAADAATGLGTLYTLDMSAGVATPIAPFFSLGLDMPEIAIDIACGNSGNLYMFDYDRDRRPGAICR